MARRVLLIGLLVLLPGKAAAQALSGAADWSYSRNTTSSEGSSNTTASFTQVYTAGYRSVLWDPRFMQYDGDVSLRKIGMNLNSEDGHLRDIGYRFGATLFGARPFPLVVSARRTFGFETGNVPMGNPLRGGLVLPPTGEMPELNSRTSNANVQWQLDTPRLPRIEFAYHRDDSTLTADEETIAQRARSLSLGASRQTGVLSNQLRFQKTSYENEFSTAFTHRLTELTYDGNAAIGRTVRTTTRFGDRTMFSLFEAPVQMPALGDQTFMAPVRGESSLLYAVQSLTWQATSRLATDATVSFDTASSGEITTRTLLASGMIRYELITGLLVDASATSGTRTQVLRGTSIDALTRSANTGLSYTSGVPHLQFGGSAHVGRGRATSMDGRVGHSTMWNGQANASSDVLRWIDLGALYEKGRTTDDLLVFGNYAIERRRLTARTRVGSRGSLQADWEHSTQERGRLPDFYTTELLTQSVGGTYLISRSHRVTFSAGSFRATYQTELDSTRFAGVYYDGQLTSLLRASASLRREIGRRSTLDQDGYLATGLLEYRVRLFTFGFEQRLTNIDYRVANRDPFQYHGNSFLIRINRRFGWMF